MKFLLADDLTDEEAVRLIMQSGGSSVAADDTTDNLVIEEKTDAGDPFAANFSSIYVSFIL